MLESSLNLVLALKPLVDCLLAEANEVGAVLNRAQLAARDRAPKHLFWDAVFFGSGLIREQACHELPS